MDSGSKLILHVNLHCWFLLIGPCGTLPASKLSGSGAGEGRKGVGGGGGERKKPRARQLARMLRGT